MYRNAGGLRQSGIRNWIRSRTLKDENFNAPTIRMWIDPDANYASNELPNKTVPRKPEWAARIWSRGPAKAMPIRASVRACATQFSGELMVGLIGRYVDASNYYRITVLQQQHLVTKTLSNGVATTLDTATVWSR